MEISSIQAEFPREKPADQGNIYSKDRVLQPKPCLMREVTTSNDIASGRHAWSGMWPHAEAKLRDFEMPVSI
jgi:hypothetical protein